MTAKCALVKSLLAGDVINIKTCFRDIGLTNAPREISRMIEQSFNVTVSRTPQRGKSRYGNSVSWVDYRLNRTNQNAEGIKLMAIYILEQNGNLAKGKITKNK